MVSCDPLLNFFTLKVADFEDNLLSGLHSCRISHLKLLIFKPLHKNLKPDLIKIHAQTLGINLSALFYLFWQGVSWVCILQLAVLPPLILNF
jgi:hypothetical protein